MDKHLRNARDPRQAERMKILKERGLCYFCQRENTEDIPFPNMVYEGQFWFITRNDYPLDGQVHFYMIVMKRHVEDEDQVNAEESAEYPKMIAWLKKYLGVTSYSTFSRNGDPEVTGGSLKHLHKHFLVGGKKPTDYEYPRDVVPVVIAFKKR